MEMAFPPTLSHILGFSRHHLKNRLSLVDLIIARTESHPAKIDLNKKFLPKQKTIQNFTIDAQGFRKTKHENPSTWEIEVTS